MANLNKVMLIGRLTRDPETRHTAGGNSVTNFGLAINRSYRKKDSDELVEETTKWRKNLIEKVSEADESLLEKYISGVEPSAEEIRAYRGTLTEPPVWARMLP